MVTKVSANFVGRVMEGLLLDRLHGDWHMLILSCFDSKWVLATARSIRHTGSISLASCFGFGASGKTPWLTCLA